MSPPWKYHSVPSSASEDAEIASKASWPGLSEAENPGSFNHDSRYLRLVAPWVASTVFFAILATYLVVQSVQHSIAPFPGTFRTDFAAARASVEYEERVFTGALDYDPISGQPYRVLDPYQPQYFGEPSAEIEAAWDELMKDEFSILSDSEAVPFTPELMPLPTDHQYHFELDVLHSLHCLNAARKKLDEYYLTPCQEQKSPRNDTAYSNNWERVHMDHCLDQLRQSIQCHGDLTPVPLYWWQGYNVALGVGKTHTCRKWEPIRKWVDGRAKPTTSGDDSWKRQPENENTPWKH